MGDNVLHRTLFGDEDDSTSESGRELLVNARLRDLAARVANLEDEVRRLNARPVHNERET